MYAGLKANLHSLWGQLFLLVLIIAANSRLYASCSDIDSRANHSGADLDRGGYHRDGSIGHGHDRAA